MSYRIFRAHSHRTLITPHHRRLSGRSRAAGLRHANMALLLETGELCWREARSVIHHGPLRSGKRSFHPSLFPAIELRRPPRRACPRRSGLELFQFTSHMFHRKWLWRSPGYLAGLLGELVHHLTRSHRVHSSISIQRVLIPQLDGKTYRILSTHHPLGAHAFLHAPRAPPNESITLERLVILDVFCELGQRVSRG